MELASVSAPVPDTYLQLAQRFEAWVAATGRSADGAAELDAAIVD